MTVNKKMIFIELNGKIKQYFEELKENTGLSNYFFERNNYQISYPNVILNQLFKFI